MTAAVAPDAGFGNERTALAWQRTALALVTGAAILSRLTFAELGVWALGSVLVAGPLGLWVLFESRGRYRHDAGLQSRERSRGGRSPAALAVATVAVGLTELAALLVA